MPNRRQFLGSSVMALAGGTLLACFKTTGVQAAHAAADDQKP